VAGNKRRRAPAVVRGKHKRFTLKAKKARKA
jgi:hypothetical protein